MRCVGKYYLTQNNLTEVGYGFAYKSADLVEIGSESAYKSAVLVVIGSGQLEHAISRQIVDVITRNCIMMNLICKF